MFLINQMITIETLKDVKNIPIDKFNQGILINSLSTRPPCTIFSNKFLNIQIIKFLIIVKIISKTINL